MTSLSKKREKEALTCQGGTIPWNFEKKRGEIENQAVIRRWWVRAVPEGGKKRKGEAATERGEGGKKFAELRKTGSHARRKKKNRPAAGPGGRGREEDPPLRARQGSLGGRLKGKSGHAEKNTPRSYPEKKKKREYARNRKFRRVSAEVRGRKREEPSEKGKRRQSKQVRQKKQKKGGARVEERCKKKERRPRLRKPPLWEKKRRVRKRDAPRRI